MASKVVQKCMDIVDGDEVNFLNHLLYTDITDAHRDDCVMLVGALAEANPQKFVAAVGAYLMDGVEVA